MNGSPPVRAAAAGRAGHARDAGAPAGEPYAALAETHTSVVLFLGDLAIKVKKPLRLPFVDLSTRQARLAVCRHEVDLNRRLAPDVYLGVAELRGRDGDGAGRDGDGAGWEGEPVVVMRRMPAARRLSCLLAAGDDVRAPLRDVARRVAALHAALPPVHGYGLAATMAELWAQGRAQLAPFEGSVLPAGELDEVAELAADYLVGRRPLFAAREAAGRVRDGHGDLLADDIFCLDDGVRILDCLEFDARLRVGDVLADAAFLAMDLQARGAAAAAAQFLADYRDFTADVHPHGLADHYIAYRAFVRAKVACLRAAQSGTAAAAGERALPLLRLCRRRLLDSRVHLVLVGGLPGSGKSTVAEGLAAAGPDRVLLCSDLVRKELAGVRPWEPLAAPYAAGSYDRAHTDATYALLLQRAGVALRHGSSVVLDASWAGRQHREAARALAADARATLTELRCRADLQRCARRVRERPAHHVSDADPAVLHAMAARFDPWPQARPVDTGTDPATAVRRASALLPGAGPRPPPAGSPDRVVPVQRVE